MTLDVLPFDFKPKGPFPLYLPDLLDGTPGWSDAERFQYVRLLNHLWKTGGKILDDLAVIAEESGLNRARNWREKAEKLRFKLVSHPTETGFLTHHRVYKDLCKAAEISQKRAIAGREGGKQLPQKKEAIAKPTRVPSPSNKQTIPPVGLTTDTPLGGDERSDHPPEKPIPKAKPPPVKGHRLPEDWQPSAACRSFAVEKGFPEDEIDDIADEFRDYWTGETGRHAAKKSWDGTWRNRIRELAKRRTANSSPSKNGQPVGGGYRREPPSFVEATMRYAARNSPPDEISD